MHQSKLIQILKKLSPIQMNRLGKYVHSPYFNSHEERTALFDLLKAVHPGFTKRKVDKQKLFQQLYPEEVYDDDRMRVLSSELLRLVWGFIAQEKLKDSPGFQKQLLLKSLEDFELEQFIPKFIEQEYKRLENEKPHSPNHFLFQWMTSSADLNYTTTQERRFSTLHFDQFSNKLDAFYLNYKLKLYCGLVQSKQIVKLTNQVEVLDELLRYCEKVDLSDYPVVGIYFEVLMFLLHLDKKEYQQAEPRYQTFEKLLFESMALLPYDDQTNLHLYAITFCNRMYRTGKMEYERKMFEWYQSMDTLKLLFIENRLSIHRYKNIVTLGLRLGEFEWTEHFVESNKKFLPDYAMTDAYHYNLAHIRLYQKSYKEVLKLLSNISIIDRFYQFGSKMIRLKAYYERNEVRDYDSFINLALDFYNNDLSKDPLKSPLPEKQKLPYKNFIRFIRRLFYAKNGSPELLDGLAAEMADCESLTERGWLMEKLEEEMV